MKDFFKAIIAVVTLQWLFGGRDGNGGSGCGCGGCMTWIVLGGCLILYLLGML